MWGNGFGFDELLLTRSGLRLNEPDPIVWTAPLDGALKVEGIAFDERGALWLTTDADAPGLPSDLRRMAWPPPEFRLQSR